MALREEIDAVMHDLARRGLDRPVPALSGRARGALGSGYRYAFQIAGGMYDIRSEDRVRVRWGTRESLGVVSRFDRGIGLLQVHVGEWLGERLAGAELEFDATWLLRELSERLADLAEDTDAFHPETVLGLLGRRPPRLGRTAPALESSADLNAPQREALERLLGSEVQLVWGPPGTGKSRLVAHAALELAREGRVLVTTTTNGAVDEVAARLSAILDPEALASGRVVRVGSDFGDAPIPEITLEAALARRLEAGAGGVLRALDELEARLGIRGAAASGNGALPGRSGTGPRARIARALGVARARNDAEAARAVGRIMVEVSRQAGRALEEADVVLTTLARLAVREELRDLRYASMILDEASTAPLPYVSLAAALTSGRAVAVGDFLQLPPVVTSRGPAAERWLRRDVFHETGVIGREEGRVSLPSPHDGLCAMLDVQYRMSAPIRALVSEFFYDGRLRDAAEIEGRPVADPAVLLLDTSALRPAVERVEGSRRNATHADVVAEFLAAAADQGEVDVAVVSPYRAQTRYLRDVARRRLGQTAPRHLQVSTIHRFQGREKGVVVLDTVDAPPGRSWFLDERRNPDLPRLLNVALSRARDRLVLVASVEGLARTLPSDALLNRIVAHVREAGGCRPVARSAPPPGCASRAPARAPGRPGESAGAADSEGIDSE